jgi:hypothetical protein
MLTGRQAVQGGTFCLFNLFPGYQIFPYSSICNVQIPWHFSRGIILVKTSVTRYFFINLIKRRTMKKIFLSAIVLATAYTLSAQEITAYRASTDPAGNTYVVPVSIKNNFQATYPGVTVVTWQPATDWWYATYKDNNNRLVSVYYNTQDYYMIRNETFNVSLPVLNTLVPESVITAAIDTYGNDLYSITAMKTSTGEDTYQVALIKNGTMEKTMMNASAVAMNSSR